MTSTSTSPMKKWWIPHDSYKKELFEKTKKDINHFLAVSQEGVPFSTFAYEFEEVTGSPVPFRELGFKTVGGLLFHMDDVVNVRQDNRHGTLFLYVGSWAPIDDEIVHIRQLVIAQGIPDKTKHMSSKGRKGMRLNTHDVPIDFLLIAEKEKYTSGNFSHQPQRSFERVKGNYSHKPQNQNRFAPWRDDRPRAVSEAGEPIRDESTSFTMSIPSTSGASGLENIGYSQSNQGPSRMPSTFSSIPQHYFQAL